MARPKLPDKDRKDEILKLRLTASDRKRLDRGAKLAGVPLSEFVREVSLLAADRLAANRS